MCGCSRPDSLRDVALVPLRPFQIWMHCSRRDLDSLLGICRPVPLMKNDLLFWTECEVVEGADGNNGVHGKLQEVAH